MLYINLLANHYHSEEFDLCSPSNKCQLAPSLNKHSSLIIKGHLNMFFCNSVLSTPNANGLEYVPYSDKRPLQFAPVSQYFKCSDRVLIIKLQELILIHQSDLTKFLVHGFGIIFEKIKNKKNKPNLAKPPSTACTLPELYCYYSQLLFIADTLELGRSLDSVLARVRNIAGVIFSQTSIAFAGWRAGFCP